MQKNISWKFSIYQVLLVEYITPFSFVSDRYEDMGIFHVFIYLSVMDRYTPPHQTKLKYVKMPISWKYHS